MRSTSGSRTCSIISRMRFFLARASNSVWAHSTSSIWRPTGTTGLSAVIGSWKIIAMVVARAKQFFADQLDAAAGWHQRALLQQAHHGQRGHGLAGSAFADQAQRLGFCNLQGDAVEDAWRLRILAETDDEIVDVENRAHLPLSRCFMRGSSASRAASPIRLTLRIATDSNRPGQKISDGLI